MRGDDPPFESAARERHRPEFDAVDDGETTPSLRLRVVRRPDGTDRCTVFPESATGITRMSTWVSVDRSCVVALEDAR